MVIMMMTMMVLDRSLALSDIPGITTQSFLCFLLGRLGPWRSLVLLLVNYGIRYLSFCGSSDGRAVACLGGEVRPALRPHERAESNAATR